MRDKVIAVMIVVMLFLKAFNECFDRGWKDTTKLDESDQNR